MRILPTLCCDCGVHFDPEYGDHVCTPLVHKPTIMQMEFAEVYKRKADVLEEERSIWELLLREAFKCEDTPLFQLALRHFVLQFGINVEEPIEEAPKLEVFSYLFKEAAFIRIPDDGFMKDNTILFSDRWYLLKARGGGSRLPVLEVGSIFKSPNPIGLVVGDSVIELIMEERKQVCVINTDFKLGE